MPGNINLQRRQWLAGILMLPVAPVWAISKLPLVEVWKDPGCGCCQDWVAQIEKAGFEVRVHEAGKPDAQMRLEIPAKFGACHTASVAGYALEGHVPAREIQRLLKEKPKAAGLAVPGMPAGSPGMDGAAYQHRKDPYDVLLIMADSRSTVYQAYR